MSKAYAIEEHYIEVIHVLDNSNTNPDTLVLISTLIAVLISQGLNNDQINVLGNVLTQVGASLLTKAAQQESLQTKEDMKNQIIDLEKQLENLKRKLC